MQSTKTRNLALVALMAAVICIMGPLSIAIPFSPVPISFTNLAIYLTVMILGWKLGTLSYLVYLALGFVGLPVFSAFTSGPGKLLGPTGGYLIGFIFMALVSGWFVNKFSGKFYMYILGMVLGTLIAYAFGTVWLGYQAGLSFGKALMAGVIPYIPGDIIKIYVGTAVGNEVRKRLLKANIRTFEG
ncbi:MAG: biotin transporter BioY [Clostridia bacterium]|nr:biotin transporter BioY [Lachnospiraceae bacterium]NCC00210.1 biotin transporter BioY [Clostridia bacterium]NCD03312.1 biotin transporter BioY [Clostridia bacterium]